jgi:hypothetical protein
MVVAIVALIAALAGSAVAAQPVTKSKAKKIANTQINKHLPIASGDLGTINVRSASQSVTNNYVELTADCQSDEKVISGGTKIDNAALATFSPYQFESHRKTEAAGQNEGWYGRAYVAGTFTYTVEAYCLEA